MKHLVSIAIIGSITTLSHSQPLIQVTNNQKLDYESSLIQLQDSSFLIAYERLNSSLSGDIWITSSAKGEVWTTPILIIGSSKNERAPCLLQKPDGTFLLYYLSDSSGSYKIYHAKSTNGTSWTKLGALNLGWTVSSQPINPSVFLESDGSYTMAYDLLNNGGYVAHSADGLVWDHNKTKVSTGPVNRIMRHSNGTYVLSYQRQTGPNNYDIDICTKTSSDLITWSAEHRVTTNMNSHDAFPLELEDGSFGLFFIYSNGQPYDLVRYGSTDGTNWNNPQYIFPYTGWDYQPHPILTKKGEIAMSWNRGTQQQTDIFFTIIFGTTNVISPTQVNTTSALFENYPNPFNPSTTITLYNPISENVELSVHNSQGQLVKQLINGHLEKGLHSIIFNAEQLYGGIYFYSLRSSDLSITKKMVLIK